MIRVAIVEDETTYRDQFQEYLKQYEKESGEEIQIMTFTDGDEIAGGYKAAFDIILMDVNMQFMDGMSAAEEIRKSDPEVVIIFITNMKQYAIRGYAVDALDYVLKPVSYFALSQRLDRAIARMKKRTAHYLTVAVKGGLQKLKVSDIYYVESQGHKLIFHTKMGEYISSGTMKETEEVLTPLHFCRANKGMLLNLEHVDGIREGCALIAGEALPISRSRRSDFMDTLTNHVSEVMK